MMVTFKLVEHAVINGRQVIELWVKDQFIGQITSDESTGVRVISKHPMAVQVTAGRPNIATVSIAATEE